MQKMGLNEIRERYLSFYETKGHLRLPSFSLVPQNDPSILLINAGMTPMKPYFSGAEKPPRTRVTTCQKCIRTPDIERVGYTSRHGTFFEMLGNFSFGDYFKEEAITWAWEFITEVLKLPEERLYVSVYHEDEEAYALWHEKIGLAPNRIVRLGKEDNFWEHGTGPCGPCSEIHYDRGPEFGCESPTCGIGCDCDRYVEFWNLVFTQFDRQEDGSYLPLKHRNIDTGGGLERFACIMQGVDNLFEVDTVRRILDAVCQQAKVAYGHGGREDVAIRVITDHIRSTTMMISDGVLPSNEGRGYVLRRLLRRAARYGRLLGIEKRFLTELVPVVIQESGGAYPELKERADYILRVVDTEEQRFEKTIRQGTSLLEGYVDEAKAQGRSILAGDLVFKLHDTFGFPVDLTKEMAAEQGLGIDDEGFKAHMKRQKEEARAAMKAKGGSAWGAGALPAGVDQTQKTRFLGYETLESPAQVLYLIGQNEAGEPTLLEQVGVDGTCMLVTDQTPFYATGGGQKGDWGTLTGPQGLKAKVLSTTKQAEGIYLHEVCVEAGVILPGQTLTLSVDRMNRLDTARNHSCTHLLHRALRSVLGDHVTQAGSDVDAQRLRFDFHHLKPCSREELKAVENQVNAAILADYPISAEVMSMAQAKEAGAMALFDEKYGDQVRVLTMGDYSCELCGGTHLDHTSQVGFFHIVSEGSVASGIRRIEAITGTQALNWLQSLTEQVQATEAVLKTKLEEAPERIQQLQTELKQTRQQCQDLQLAQAKAQALTLMDQVVQRDEIQVLVASVAVNHADTLRELAEDLRSKLGASFVMLGSAIEDKLSFVALASPEAIAKGLKAGDWVKKAAQLTGGGGGGRPDRAQAGGREVDKLDEALETVRREILAQ